MSIYIYTFARPQRHLKSQRHSSTSRKPVPVVSLPFAHIRNSELSSATFSIVKTSTPAKMKSIISFGAIIISSLAIASPIPPPCPAACPEVFTLKIATPGHNYTGLSIINSGLSTYLTTNPLFGTDYVARFYRNDTTHLYATGFNTSYMGKTQTPPYQ